MVRVPPNLPTQLTNLAKFLGVSPQASYFCTGRPVVDLYLECWGYGGHIGLPSDLAFMDTASLKVLNLYWVYWQPNFLKTVANKCPFLESLTIQAVRYTALTPIYNIPHMLQLKSVTLKTGFQWRGDVPLDQPGQAMVSVFQVPSQTDPEPTRADLEREILQKFIAACPLLQYIRFHDHFYWAFLGVTDGWEHFASD